MREILKELHFLKLSFIKLIMVYKEIVKNSWDYVKFLTRNSMPELIEWTGFAAGSRYPSAPALS